MTDYINDTRETNENFDEQQIQPMSVGGWIWRPLLMFIPCVGPIVYIVMLFIWRKDKTKDTTFKNWATSQLILTAISLVLSVAIGIVVVLGGLAGPKINIRIKPFTEYQNEIIYNTDELYSSERYKVDAEDDASAISNENIKDSDFVGPPRRK